MQVGTPLRLVLGLFLITHTAHAELWRCKNGVYLSTPSPELECKKVESSTKCNKNGTRVISAKGDGEDEECPKEKPDPFLRVRRNTLSNSAPATSSSPQRGNERLPSTISKTQDMNPSIEGLSDVEIARRSAHNPMYMQKWASRADSSSTSAYPGMGSASSMQRDVDSFKRGVIPKGYQ